MRKKIITLVAAACVGALVGAALGYGSLLRYRSDGLLSIELSIIEYKRVTGLADNPETARAYASVTPPLGWSDHAVASLMGHVARGDWHKPVPKFSRTDMKDLPEFLLQLEREPSKIPEHEKASDRRDTRPVYLGVNLSYVGKNPSEVAEAVRWLGFYFRDVAARESLLELVSGWTEDHRQFAARAAARKLRYEFDLKLAQARAVTLRRLTPGVQLSLAGRSSDVDDRRSAAFHVAEAEDALARLRRESEQHVLLNTVMGALQSAVSRSVSGADTAKRLSEVLDEVNVPSLPDAQREKVLSMAADVKDVSRRYIGPSRFLVAPSPASSPEKPTPVMMSIFFAMVFACLAAAFIWRGLLYTACFVDGMSAAKKGIS